jgi:hypothetical protein
MEIAERNSRTKERTMANTQTRNIYSVDAGSVRAGDMLVLGMKVPPVKVLAAMTCSDGSIRLLTTGPEQRMTRSVRVRLQH